MESARGIGDFDADGFADVLLTIHDGFSPGESGTGWSAVLVYGRPGLGGRHVLDATFSSRIAILWSIGAKGSSPGQSIGPAGDLNRDGSSDFFVGFTQVTHEGGGWGEGYLLYGTDRLQGDWDLLMEEIGTRIPGVTFWSSDPADAGVGGALANIGDFNGDRRIDIAVGAAGWRRDGTEQVGRLCIILGVDDLPARVDLDQVGKTIPGVRVLGAPQVDLDGVTLKGPNFGYRVVGVGDVDGDGFDDVLVKAKAIFTFPAHSYLIYGSAKRPEVIDLIPIAEGAEVKEVTHLIEPEGSGTDFTGSALGDVNGDGLADVLFGAHGHYAALFNATKGATYILYGSKTRTPEIDFNALPPGLATKYVGLKAGDYFGVSVAPAGDLNQDGLPDFLVGASRAFRDDQRFVGEAYAIFGNNDFGIDVKSLEDDFSGIRLLGEEIQDYFGDQVSPAGDFNGDGVNDMLVLAPHSAGPVGEARAKAYLIYGSGSGAVPLKLYSLDPAWGPLSGGKAITLRGQGFSGKPAVRFGTRDSASVVVLSSTELRAMTPPGDALGAVEVVVQVGAETARLPGAFEYIRDLPEVDLRNLGGKGLVLEFDYLPVRFADGANSPMVMVDFNGDGVDDLISIWTYDPVEPAPVMNWNLGILKGGASLPPLLSAGTPSNHLTIMRSSSEPYGPSGVHGIGDVNGDGIDDIIIVNARLKAILFGRRDLAPEVDLQSQMGNPGALVRILRSANEVLSDLRDNAVAVGDLTGDGIDDFALASSRARSGPGNSGPSGAGDIIFVAGRREWPESIDLDDPQLSFARVHGVLKDQRFGMALAAAGDINGDGLVDLVSVERVDSAASAGRGYVLFPRRGMPAEVNVEHYVIDGGGMMIDFQGGLLRYLPWVNISGAGDVDGDRYADVLLGVPGGGQDLQGVTYLIRGGADLLPQVILEENPAAPDGVVRIRGEGSEEFSGTVGAAGDFDGDGYADFVIGATGQQQDTSGKLPGNVFLIFGAKAWPDRIELRDLRGHGIKIQGRADDFTVVGGVVGRQGDLNGDGHADFAFTENDIFTPIGDRVFVLYGQGADRRFVRGDANGDGAVEVSDAISTIGYLFLGTGPGPCKDALDTDDSGTIEITDAIYLLTHLFLGGPTPPAPYPAPGADRTQDALDCEGV